VGSYADLCSSLGQRAAQCVLHYVAALVHTSASAYGIEMYMFALQYFAVTQWAMALLSADQRKHLTDAGVVTDDDGPAEALLEVYQEDRRKQLLESIEMAYSYVKPLNARVAELTASSESAAIDAVSDQHCAVRGKSK
jgi:hypothetical protein